RVSQSSYSAQGMSLRPAQSKKSIHRLIQVPCGQHNTSIHAASSVAFALVGPGKPAIGNIESASGTTKTRQENINRHMDKDEGMRTKYREPINYCVFSTFLGKMRLFFDKTGCRAKGNAPMKTKRARVYFSRSTFARVRTWDRVK